MQISELARRSGVPLSSVKYYQREHMLPEGVRSASANQVDYAEPHLQRLRLIRALLEIGGLSVAATRDVLRSLDDGGRPLAETFETAQHAMSAPRTAAGAPSDAARQRIAELARARGWVFTDDNPGIDVAARAIDGLEAIDFHAPEEYLQAYAVAAVSAAVADLQALRTRSDADRIAELMVVGTVLGDPLFAGLRRIAHQDATSALFPVEPNVDDA